MILEPRSRSFLAVAAILGLSASCQWMDPLLLPERLQACPALAETYFGQSTNVMEDEFPSYDIDMQFQLYICGNQYIHPPLIFLKTPLAMQGEGVAAYLEGKLIDPEIDDLTIRDIVLVFEEMEYLNSYDVRDDTALRELLQAKSREIEDPELRAFVQEQVAEIVNQ